MVDNKLTKPELQAKVAEIDRQIQSQQDDFQQFVVKKHVEMDAAEKVMDQLKEKYHSGKLDEIRTNLQGLKNIIQPLEDLRAEYTVQLAKLK